MVNFTLIVERLEFCTLMDSFCSNHINFQLNKYIRVISHDTEEWCKVSRKTDLWFQIWHEKFGEFSSKHWKVWKFHFDGLFLSNVFKVWAKKYRWVIFPDTEQWSKIWINSDLAVSKMAWGIGLTFIRALKSLKNCTLMGSFCQEHIMFQLETLRGIIHWRVL